jgi:hypothetical protein
MIVTRIKYKYAVVKVDINKLERFLPIDVRLPANVKRVTGVLVTASRK